MKDKVIGVYKGIDRLFKSYFLQEALINVWQKNHKNYSLELKIKMNEGNVFTLLLECREQ
tara:strand:+ start:1164 stop:1343 length:180 start_codon:yes stop_codon:yes gene_type:complete